MKGLILRTTLLLLLTILMPQLSLADLPEPYSQKITLMSEAFNIDRYGNRPEGFKNVKIQFFIDLRFPQIADVETGVVQTGANYYGQTTAKCSQKTEFVVGTLYTFLLSAKTDWRGNPTLLREVKTPLKVTLATTTPYWQGKDCSREKFYLNNNDFNPFYRSQSVSMQLPRVVIEIPGENLLIEPLKARVQTEAWYHDDIQKLVLYGYNFYQGLVEASQLTAEQWGGLRVRENYSPEGFHSVPFTVN